ncbi:GNAT family N-acetyltransferase [Pseudoalteromonas obscura]|uniref:GNAT family N-acetyltransferase n=1 Tax=Pseudoalteromonas obscura TaxID=3048491 RepID=A0ABT7ESY5_9GAMM|nr:GNAT family N-acetyltransferase [Pseudoalteromonas sp. P94(2023)]MDK2598170.1 GNAT family N-acetyltransferase [Pseudoalteromonas sp. P94(2023)]
MDITMSPLALHSGSGLHESACDVELQQSWPFLLTPIYREDAEAALRKVSEQTCHNLGIDALGDIRCARRFVQGCGSQHQCRYAIRHTVAGLIGGLAYGRLSYIGSADIAELSYWLTESFRGRGVMTWALKQLFMEMAQQGINKVVANVYVENVKSQTLLCRLGFHQAHNVDVAIRSYHLALTERLGSKGAA